MPKRSSDLTPPPSIDATETTAVPRVLQLNRHELVDGASQGRPCLVIVSGADRGRVIPLEEGKTRIGRTPSKSHGTVLVVLNDSQVSRRHAVFHISPDGRVEVEDIGSTNGTILGLLPVKDRVAIQPGDHLAFGQTVVLLVLSEEVAHRVARDLPAE